MSKLKSPSTSKLKNKFYATAPTEPGIYKMLDSVGEVIYVGKAKNLQKRLSSYFLNRQDRDIKTAVLVSHIRDVQTIVTRSEDEALILERQLIRALQPRYNIALKDDKNYPYIKLTINEPFPKMAIVRSKFKDNARYFGPFPSVGSTRHLQRLMLQLFPLRDCKQAISLTTPEPKCIKLDLGQCLGPCVRKYTKPDYDQIVQDLILFLQGRRTQLFEKLESEMWQASASHRFEKAAILRDALTKLKMLHQRQVVQLEDLEDVQVWVMVENAEFRYALVQSFVEGKLLYQNGFYSQITPTETEADFLDRAIYYFFSDQNPDARMPKKIFTDPAFESALTQVPDQKWMVLQPKIGDKAEVIQTATRNAQLALSRLVAKTHEDTASQLLLDVQSTLHLSQYPRVIWGIDISHWYGQNIVGSLVCFKDGRPYKPGYRRTQIRSIKGKSNDPKSIYEVVLRQVENAKDALPDLILIDGGRGQLNFAQEALRVLGLSELPMIALAKREEEIYSPNQRKPLKLEGHHPVRQLCQRIRDEAHRFAVTYQRQKRSLTVQTQLNEIPGLGPKRINQLFKTYHTLSRMAQANVTEMAEIGRMGEPLAKRVIHYCQKTLHT